MEKQYRCNRCNAPIREFQNICGYCGQRFVWNQPPQNQPPQNQPPQNQPPQNRPPQSQPPQAKSKEGKKVSGMAITALSLGAVSAIFCGSLTITTLLGTPCWLVGIVFAIISLNNEEVRTGKRKGLNLAILGFVTCGIGLLRTFLWFCNL